MADITITEEQLRRRLNDLAVDYISSGAEITWLKAHPALADARIPVLERKRTLLCGAAAELSDALAGEYESLTPTLPKYEHADVVVREMCAVAVGTLDATVDAAVATEPA
jgi:hypothetical protein